MNVRSPFGWLAAGLVLLNLAGLAWIRHEVAGRGRPTVRILSALPTEHVDQTDRFSLLFDEPLSAGSIPGASVETCPFVIQPQPKGHWAWSRPDRLDFVLEEPLPPGRVFTIRPAANMQTQTGRVLIGQNEYQFQTRALQLDSCQFGSGDREHVTVELGFNQPVAPADLLHHLQVVDSANGRVLRTVCLTSKPDVRLVIRCNRPKKDKIEVRLAGGLTGSGAELALGEPIHRTLDLPETFALLHAEVSQDDLDPSGTVNLVFSQDLDEKQAVPAVELTPAVTDAHVSIYAERLVVQGSFEPGRKYTAAVAGEIRSAKGEGLAARQSLAFEVPDRDAALRFPLRHGTLMPAGQMQVDLKVVNLAGVKLTAYRVYANNLLAHVRGERPHEVGRQLLERLIPLTLARNAITTVTLDLRQLLDSTSKVSDRGPATQVSTSATGIYVVRAEATDRSWTDDQAIVTISDLAITAKQEHGGCLVWVTSLGTAKPLAGVEVAALSRTNQALATGLTDEQGLAHLAIPEDHPDGPLFLITAQAATDLNFLKPGEQAWMIDDVDQTGKAYTQTYDVMLYTERGIYRPGDTIHLTGLVRDSQGRVPEPFPLEVTLKRPDGRKVERHTVSPEADRQGFFHTELPTPSDGQLGKYDISVALPGDTKPLGGTSALVEEYVPVRMEVTAQPTQPRFCAVAYVPGESNEACTDPSAGSESEADKSPSAASQSQPAPTSDIVPSIQVKARYLFGQPASQLPLKVAATYKRVAFQSRQFPRYTFADADPDAEIEVKDIEAQLDETGLATVEVPIGDEAGAGCWQAKVSATVNEPGGRSVSAHTRIDLDTAGRHVGLLAPSARIVPVGEPLQIEWIQVTSADELAPPGLISWTLQRVDYDTTLETVGKHLVWKSQERLSPAGKGQVTAVDSQAKGAFQIRCPAGGFYRLEVIDEHSRAATRIEFHAATDRDQDQDVAMDKPEMLRLVLDQEKYLPGSQAKVLVTSPFAGTLLLTLESDRVLCQQIVQMQANTTTLDLTIPQDLRGGAFLAGTVVRAVDPAKDKWFPHRAAGLTRVVVDHTAKLLPVTIEAPARARPKEKIRLQVRTSPPANTAKPGCVHVWAVDEGILKTIGFRTPDPMHYFLSPHEAAVSSADGYGSLLPDYQRPSGMTRIGGDEGGRAPRHSLVPARRREAAVLWRSVAAVGEDGTAAIEVDLPDITGEIRFMAVAADQDQFGSAQQAVTVTAPLLVEASWPRFAAPGDQFDVPVKIFNATAQALRVTLKSGHMEGPLEIKWPTDSTVTVGPAQPVTVWLAASATGMGQALAEVQATATLEGDPLIATCKADLPIRPAVALGREVRLHRVAASQPLQIAVPENFIPGTVRATLSIGARPIVQMQPALEQLIDYPYGCVEQTTSRLVALLYAPDLLAHADQAQARAAAIGNRIDAGIARLWSMQTVSGGLGYWPGDRDADLWGSAYAANLLLRARQAGYRVDKQFIDPLVAYLAGEVQKVDENLDPNVRAMLCSALAGFGKPPQGWMDRLAERTDQLDIAGRADLAAAFLAGGRKDRALEILKDDTLKHSVAKATGNRLTSQVHQDAALLHVLLDLDPDHPWIGPLVQRLDAARVAGKWGSTLENATALSALARYQLLARETASFTGSVRGAGQDLPSFGSQVPVTFQIKRLDGPLDIVSTGTGDLYVSAAFEGLLKQGQAKDYDHQLTVRRRWLARDGKPIDPLALKIGDLVRVEIELAAPELEANEQIDHLAIVDALPACLEVENPRLITSIDSSSCASDAAPQRVEFRDDRVLLFTSASSTAQTYRYSLRVVAAGSFIVPPVEASSMYDAQFASLSGGRKAEVSR
jgi:alpha-2-macroglobulin